MGWLQAAVRKERGAWEPQPLVVTALSGSHSSPFPTLSHGEGWKDQGPGVWGEQGQTEGQEPRSWASSSERRGRSSGLPGGNRGAPLSLELEEQPLRG